jgi:microcin C transport system permease protein
MTVLVKLLETAALLWAGYLFTHRALPFLYVKAGAALGFDMKLAPHWEKRIKRFKTIKRGYYSFLIITTLFVLSLFLELMVNNKPLFIRYGSRVSFPAVSDWADGLLFFKHPAAMNRKSDFGQIGDDAVDYRRFAAARKDPSLFDAQARGLEGEAGGIRKQLAVKPGPRANPEELQDYKDLQEMVPAIEAEIKAVGEAKSVFAAGKAQILMPVYPYSPREHLLDMPGRPPHRPGAAHLLGTDDSAADVFAQLAYGFRTSLSFALIVSVLGYLIGIIVGGVMGYFGGWVDILMQRFIEIWSSIPFLFLLIIIASIIQPTFLLLVSLIVLLQGWVGISYYIRGEFYREKSRDYVHAAVAMGASEWSVMMKHILPNSLVPLVTFAPFSIVGTIGSLVSLDFLGFGLPVGTPSWGVLLDQGMKYLKYYPHLILTPSIALAVTLFMVVMVGEAVREAFDPKVFSRLR